MPVTIKCFTQRQMEYAATTSIQRHDTPLNSESDVPNSLDVIFQDMHSTYFTSHGTRDKN